MGREALIRIQGARLGSHPAALAALEGRLVEFCPSLRDHQCRGEECYRILRSTGQASITRMAQLRSRQPAA